MKILLLSAEVSPFAKVGGLADVAGSLPKALKKLGHDVRVAMPEYRMIQKDLRWQIQPTLTDFEVKLGPSWTKPARLGEAKMGETPIYFLGTDQWFNESISSQTVYLPGSDQHLFFAGAILTAMERLEWIPDVVHCNDWHTGFVPVIMRELAGPLWDETAAIFTIHNLAYQGEFDEEILVKVGLPPSLFNFERLETYGRVNFLKAGCVYADQVNTVSPTYAKEIETPEYGCRLEGLMRHLDQFGRFSGILNGIDIEEFDPETDENISYHYSSTRLGGKAECKKAVLEELRLRYSPEAALLGVVSRLSSQKGMDLLIDSAEALFQMKISLIVQGLGDPWIADEFRHLQDAFPNQFRFAERFDAGLAQRIYAGADMFLMPSSFEPCGLGQMIAMRYGTVPLVRKTGGLADTVFDSENGFVFERRSTGEFHETVQRAVDCFQNPSKWRPLVKAAMAADHSWKRSACQYVELYLKALEDRRSGSGKKMASSI